MALTFRTTAHCEVGLVRKNNQDSAYVSPGLLVVADGMGGAAAGDLASAVAVAAIAEMDADLAARVAAASTGRPDAAPRDLPEGPRGDLLAVLADTLDLANHHIARLVADDPGLDGMGTTLCGLALLDAGAAVVNIGDSRAYLLRDGVLARISKDHSWVQTLVDQGRLTEQEALEHPHRSLILRVLNGKAGHAPDFDYIDLRPGDRVLVCSDGLCGLVYDALIAEKLTIADRDVAVASLVDLAHEAGGYDNITIVVADVVDGEPEGGVQVLGSARTQTIPAASDAPTLTDLPRVTARTPRPASPEVERYAPLARRGLGSRVRVVLGVLVPVVLIVGGAFGWYSYTQTRFYVGPNDATVAVFQGVPDRILGRALSHVVADDGTRIADLPPLYADRVNNIITVDNLAAGQASLSELKVWAARCVAQRAAHARATEVPVVTPTTSPSPSPGPSGTPSASVSPSATPGTPSASVSPSATLGTPIPPPAQPTLTEDC